MKKTLINSIKAVIAMVLLSAIVSSCEVTHKGPGAPPNPAGLPAPPRP